MQKLKKIRLSTGYSLQAMANKLNVSKTFYWQIENKKRRLSYNMAIKIAKIFNMKPDELFFYETKKTE